MYVTIRSNELLIMIPEFPLFKKLELGDKADVEKFTAQYPPYSDFNFVSMWSWDVKDEMLLSILNNNLVVRFTDYLTGKKFYSFLGDNKVDDTALQLLKLSQREGLGTTLKLLPEDSAKSLNKEKFHITEDRDHFDYVFGIKNLVDYPGSSFQKHRNMVRRFEKKHKFEVLNLSLENIINQKLLLDLVQSWITRRKEKARAQKDEDYLQMEDMENELTAFKKLLSAPAEFLQSLLCSALFIDGNLSGFIINQKISQNYCLAHFGKADTQYEGIYHFLMQQNAKVCSGLEVSYLNHEQDLGFKNLRFSKEAYNPVHFLKKYTVAL